MCCLRPTDWMKVWALPTHVWPLPTTAEECHAFWKSRHTVYSQVSPNLKNQQINRSPLLLILNAPLFTGQCQCVLPPKGGLLRGMISVPIFFNRKLKIFRIKSSIYECTVKISIFPTTFGVDWFPTTASTSFPKDISRYIPPIIKGFPVRGAFHRLQGLFIWQEPMSLAPFIIFQAITMIFASIRAMYLLLRFFRQRRFFPPTIKKSHW